MKPLLTFLSLSLLLLASACATSPAAPENSDEQPSCPYSYPSSYPNSSPSCAPFPLDAGESAQAYPSLAQTAQPADPNNPHAPLPEDAKLESDTAYLDSSELQTVSTFPPEYLLVLSGSLPTPCHALRVKIDPPDEKNNLNIEVYSVADPNMVCAQVIQSFEASIPLKNLIPGRYVVWLNGEKIAEIDG